MNNLTKKLVVGFLALSMALTATAGAFAQEDTSDDVAEIEALAESLGIDASVLLEGLGVESQEEEEGEEEETASIEGIPEGFTFSNNMAQGAEGEAVKYLQILLNTNQDTQVAEEGPGSPGNETEYFGPVTRAAVTTFQEKYDSEVLQPVGLSQGTGYVGSSTRAKLNELLGEGGGEGAEAPSTSMSAVLEQLQELATALQDLRERVDSLDPGSEDAEEGELSTEVRSDIRNVELNKNQTKDVAMYRVEAENSDVDVQRFDVYVDGSMTDFRSDIDHMALKVDGDVIAEKEVNRSTIERDDEYVRFSGLNVEVLEGDYVDFVIEVTSNDTDNFNASSYGVGPAKSDAIRGIDGANLTVYSDSSDVYRTFDLTNVTGAVLEMEDDETPEVGTVQVDMDDSTEVELLNFDLSVEDSDLDHEKLTVHFTGEDASGALADGTTDEELTDIFQDVLLYHEGDLVDVQSVSLYEDGNDVFDDANSPTASDNEATATFEVDMDLEKDTTYNFTVVADVFGMDIDDSTEQARIGSKIKADILETENENIAYAYDTEAYVDLTGGDLTGNYQTLHPTLPAFDLTGSDINVDSDDDTVSGYLTTDMEAVNGDITITDINVANEGTYGVGTGGTYDAGSGWDVVIEIDGTEVYTTADGESGTYGEITDQPIEEGETLEMEIFGDNDVTGWVRLGIDSITWEDEAGNSTTWSASDYEMVEELRTNRVNN